MTGGVRNLLRSSFAKISDFEHRMGNRLSFGVYEREANEILSSLKELENQRPAHNLLHPIDRQSDNNNNNMYALATSKSSAYNNSSNSGSGTSRGSLEGREDMLFRSLQTSRSLHPTTPTSSSSEFYHVAVMGDKIPPKRDFPKHLSPELRCNSLPRTISSLSSSSQESLISDRNIATSSTTCTNSTTNSKTKSNQTQTQKPNRQSSFKVLSFLTPTKPSYPALTIEELLASEISAGGPNPSPICPSLSASPSVPQLFSTTSTNTTSTSTSSTHSKAKMFRKSKTAE